ncbi:hypothetical protein IYR97_01265 [Pseudomonas fulva]|uniref:Uncharacterized protein n=1 Tax=Pseudomonas fulva TaxID=47880 RepID=A0A7S9L894_9PSED|nr:MULTISPECIES: hypothetical protein [Pseudomonas]MBA6125299.1 hypothetical protein [Pseudomonas juntendi]QPH44312.1 hypothetical protein IYR97_01265 [Pseudomonas fulva]QPH49387.1 hypothetical protein IZU98_01235 [Pseudomonas fulva]
MDIEVYFYELVDKLAREEVNLIEQEVAITRCVAHAFPEAKEIAVFGSFYGFSLPAGAAIDRSARLRRLGRSLAEKMPALCRLAMRRYESKDHPTSNQLFRRVKGKKRLASCREQYNDV